MSNTTKTWLFFFLSISYGYMQFYFSFYLLFWNARYKASPFFFHICLQFLVIYLVLAGMGNLGFYPFRAISGFSSRGTKRYDGYMFSNVEIVDTSNDASFSQMKSVNWIGKSWIHYVCYMEMTALSPCKDDIGLLENPFFSTSLIGLGSSRNELFSLVS